ncbi:MAG: hypothetical protein PHH28_13330 [Desulfuromonadaceae bacterium]|nr:hypothetical protein [Desulfuromonadaceae bacterium]
MEWNIENHKGSKYISAVITGSVTVDGIKKLVTDLLVISKQTQATKILADHSNVSIVASILTIAAIFSVGVLSAHVSKTEENDAMPIRHVGVLLIQTVQVAEQKVHGKAVRTEFEHGKQNL